MATYNMPSPAITNRYGPASGQRRVLTSTQNLRGINPGDPGDFWADLGRFSRYMKPREAPISAPRQAAAIREPARQAAPAAVDPVQAAYAAALNSRAPLRLVSGPQINPGYVLDTNAMTGAQRQIFLPQTSQFSGPQGAPLTGPGIGAGATAQAAATPAPVDESGAHRAFRDWGTMVLNKEGQPVVPSY